MKEDPLDQLRAICLALPEASEQGGVGDPSFKVRDKIFAMQHRVNDRFSMWCKAPPGAQDVLVGSDPKRFFVPLMLVTTGGSVSGWMSRSTGTKSPTW